MTSHQALDMQRLQAVVFDLDAWSASAAAAARGLSPSTQGDLA
jgi:hypothetical protein